MTGRFPLAPMSTLMRVLTLVVLSLPFLFLVVSLTDPAAGLVLAPTTSLLALLYLGIFVWSRPRAYRIDRERLVLEFPLRKLVVPRSLILDAVVMEKAELKRATGFAVRVGAGGLFGVFGYLWTKKRGWVEIHSSREDRMVWIERQDGIPLLISPEDGSGFVRALIDC
jgi:hypothetical protein